MRFAAAILLALVVASCSPAPQSSQSGETAAAAPEAVEAAPAPDTTEPPAAEAGPAPAEAPSESDMANAVEDIEPGAGVPMEEAPVVEAPVVGAPSAPPPAPAAPTAMPPAAAGDPPASPDAYYRAARNGHGGSKVLSYFQRTRTQIDTRRAFGFVLMPKVAVTDEEKRVQKDFCTIVLASMDFMTPGAVASAPRDVLATYWPVQPSRVSFEIADAFAQRNCDELLAWYDHGLARTLAAKAGVAELSGPLLITWPASGADGETARDPLIVDFSKADHERATKALQYWFRQLRARPELWTNRIREGTIRAELADAVNDTAGVVLAVMSGKWDSLNVVMAQN